MTEHHHDHPLVTVAVSMAAGMATWLTDPNVWRALAVAAAAGFVGGVARAAGVWTWNKVRERRDKKQG